MDRLRTFGVVAHIDAGKTTLTERILFDSGAQSWVGSVDDGTSTMDWLPAERSRGISIKAAATRVTWRDHVLQVVDTPGHVDFVAEVERCLHVLDGVIVLIDGVRGVESQTEAVWQQAAERALPRLVFVNKLDRVGADFHAVVRELAERLECKPLPLVVPLRDESGAFAGLGDVITGAVQWFDGRPSAELAAKLIDELRAAHDRAVDAAADADESVLADALGGQRIAPERLRAALRAQFLAGALVPVLGGAALWNHGVDWLLDAVTTLMPAASEVPRSGLWSAENAGDADAPFCGFVFKVQHVDGRDGERAWNFVRVVRGRVAAGAAWTRGRQPFPVATLETLWQVHADRHVAIASAGPGEIVVVPGELGLRTGDTICDPGAPVTLPAPRFPAPVLAVTFEPAQAEDGAAMAAVLRELEIDDPTLRVEAEAERIVVHGMGELHLDIVADVVRARTGVSFTTSKPRVDRRETIERRGTGTAELRALVAGDERTARCTVVVEPAADSGVARVVDDVRSSGSAAAVEELALRAASGTRVGPLQGAVVTLQQASGDARGTVEPLLQQAAAKAFGLALADGELVELEPWVHIELWCPEEGSAPVIADLGARGATVSSIASGRLGARVQGRAPLQRMLGYVTKLRSMTKGRGQVFLRPLGHAPVRD